MAQRKETTITRWIYPFGGKNLSPPNDKNLLGGKGAGLAEMVSIGLPVPPGMIITTEACNAFRRAGHRFFDGFVESLNEGLLSLEETMDLHFGDAERPLLVSVRSGARVSMPGMMDTILNLGLNEETVVGFAQYTKNERLAFDSYRRLIAMFGSIVGKIPPKEFEKAFAVLKLEEGVENDIDLSIHGLQMACQIFDKIYREQTGELFPQNVHEQLHRAIASVFRSWDGERAVLYREIHNYPDDWGTAVTVQAMVFGNKNQRSATGVGFTRDPATGENHFYGEFLQNAQGEEVVAGKRTPHPLNVYQKRVSHSDLSSLEELMPDVYQELVEIVHRLEEHYKDMQDIEFTIDDGRLFMLQTRTGKRTGFAAVRMAIEMLDEGLIDEKTALQRVQPEQLAQLLAPVFEEKVKKAAAEKWAAKGLNAGPGAASGIAVFSAEKAVEVKGRGERSILIREEANPDDFPGLVAAEGILTTRGGSTSHAAVVARGMGKPCVVGCSSLHLNEEARTLSNGTLTIHEGDPLAIDGTTGEVFFCSLPTSLSEINQVLLTKEKKAEESPLFLPFDRLMCLADKYRRLDVYANADSADDCLVARAFGAQGVGLCRTEHMFLEFSRLNDVRCMLFSTEPEQRKRAIERLLPHQKNDFMAIFRAMTGLPVTIRLLDPPLHEFMPRGADELETLARMMHISREKLAQIKSSLEETNPMLGNRGCRLGIVNPELTAMQTRAILEAAIEVAQEGVVVHPEIMIPLVSLTQEFHHQKMWIDKTAKRVFAEKGREVPYEVGTMIELPRAALLAGEIAREATFFSFGTNDLTQTTFGISRDDSAKFVPFYVRGVAHPENPEEKFRLLNKDPFQVLDEEGVGEFIRIAIERGKATRPDLHCGICGEHGGEAASIAFCNRIGLDYVSCSPYRVPIARLAAGIANL